MPSEDDLCRDFAEAVNSSPEFMLWILGKTKFSKRAVTSRLLYQEQIDTRPQVLPERWWRHWWCTFSVDGAQGETDIFLVFQDTKDDFRFALHIENKAGASLSITQARNYKPRALFMANQLRFLSYEDSCTLILCTKKFHADSYHHTKIFDGVVFHDQIAEFIPSYR